MQVADGNGFESSRIAVGRKDVVVYAVVRVRVGGVSPDSFVAHLVAPRLIDAALES